MADRRFITVEEIDAIVQMCFDEPPPARPAPKPIKLLPEPGLRNLQPATAHAVMAVGITKTMGFWR